MVWKRLRSWLTGLPENPNTDLILLIAVSCVFTVLGVTGLAEPIWLTSAVLGMLAILAFSQIRSRHQVRDLVAGQQLDPWGKFLKVWPDNLEQRRSEATDLLLIGTSLSRTVPSLRRNLPTILLRGGQVRVLLLDPASPRGPNAASLRRRIEQTISDLEIAADGAKNIHIRVLSRDAAAGFNVVDPKGSSGLVVVQHREHRASNEQAPIFRLVPSDSPWFLHFLDEAERLWSSGTPWSPPGGIASLYSIHGEFREAFNEELSSAIATAKGLLITGVARNTLFRDNFKAFERALGSGVKIEVVLQDPNGPNVDIAAQRYYADRSPQNLRDRIQQTRDLLVELKRMSQGDLTLSYTRHPLGSGLVAATFDDPKSDPSVLMVEYYTYQAAGEPKLVLNPSDGAVYQSFLGEARALARSATSVGLSARPDEMPLPHVDAAASP